mgnify:CR=1 FL=1
MTDLPLYVMEDSATGETAACIYITTIEGDEVASIAACDLSDELIIRYERQWGMQITGEFSGGTLDGVIAF